MSELLGYARFEDAVGYIAIHLIATRGLSCPDFAHGSVNVKQTVLLSSERVAGR